MSSELARFRVRPGQSVQLRRRDARAVPAGLDKRAAQKQLADVGVALGELQWQLYAENRRSLLVVLQGMDASGKDGVIRTAFAQLSPLGIRVSAFRAPTPFEASHDFLWRIHRQVPAAGEIVFFNRSHYEDLLVPGVYGQLDDSRWASRVESINAFEKHLSANGTQVIKIFLHISKKKQLERFGKRLQIPAKRWKISHDDYRSRDVWGRFQIAYERVFRDTSTAIAPWHIVPADASWYRNLIVARLVESCLRGLKIEPPQPVLDLAEIRELYEAERARAGHI